MNRLDIINGAINRIGRTNVSSIEDDDVALLLDQQLLFCVQELSTCADWTFLTDYDSLSKTTFKNPTYDWACAYQLPPYFKKVVRFPNDLVHFQIVGNLLLTGNISGPIDLYYIKVDPDNLPISQFSPDFSESLMWLMVSKIALPVTENENLWAESLKSYKEKLNDAILSNQMMNPNFTAPNNIYERYRL